MEIVRVDVEKYKGQHDTINEGPSPATFAGLAEYRAGRHVRRVAPGVYVFTAVLT